MNGILLWVLLITAVAGMGGTGLGGIIGACFNKDSSKTVSLLLSFAAGVMLSVVCFDLVSDALFHTIEGEVMLIPVVVGILVGFCLIWLLNYIIDKSTNHEIEHVDDDHPATADSLEELTHINHLHEHRRNNSSLFAAGLIMACAIALHNMPEGMVIGSAYVGVLPDGLWSGGGLLMAMVIGLHNIPEGMAVSVPLIAGGMSKPRAIITTALTGLPTVIGAFIGYTLGSIGPIWHAMLLSFASGAMIYVIFGELLPESILMCRSKLPALGVIIGMLLGIVLIFI